MILKPDQRDAIFKWLLTTCAAISGGVIVFIVLFLILESIPAFTEIGFVRFFADDSWSPTVGKYNMLPMLVGTLAVALGAVLLTAPIGIGLAVFLRFYAPAQVGLVFKRMIEILAGIPSVVYGLWGLSVIVPLLAEVSPIGQGQSLLAGILILSMMSLPTITLATGAAIDSISLEQFRAAAALGLSRRSIAWAVVLPSARQGIVTGIILQIARVLGETMAVLMICGNIVQLPKSFFAPIRTLTANIALEMGYADSLHRSVLFVSGFVLLSLVIVLTLLAARINRSRVEVVS